MHNPFEADETQPVEFHWKWEEKLALAIVLLWIIAAAVGAYFMV